MVLGLRHGGGAGAGLADQGDRHDLRRPAVRPRRHRREQRAPRATPSASPSCATASTSCRWSWACSASSRSCAISSSASSARALIVARSASLWPTREEFRDGLARGAARHRPRLAARHPAGRRRGARLVRELHAGEEDRARTRRASASGAIEGVAGPESANNAAAQTSFIPLLTLGLPSNAVMALMMGAMIIQGIQPGSAVMTKRPDLFWGMVASMWIGNLMLVIINLPLIGIWVRLLHGAVPAAVPGDPAVLRDRRLHRSTPAPPDVVLTAAVRAVRLYLLVKLGCEPAPLVLGLHPRAADGGESAPLAGDLARRPDDLRRHGRSRRRCWLMARRDRRC